MVRETTPKKRACAGAPGTAGSLPASPPVGTRSRRRKRFRPNKCVYRETLCRPNSHFAHKRFDRLKCEEINRGEFTNADTDCYGLQSNVECSRGQDRGSTDNAGIRIPGTPVGTHKGSNGDG